MAATSGNDPLSPGRQPGCDTCRTSGQKLAADLRLERSTSGLTVRFPHLVGLSAKNRNGLVYRFTAPRLHATDRSVRRTLDGGFRVVGERIRALVTYLPPALRRRQGQIR